MNNKINKKENIVRKMIRVNIKNIVDDYIHKLMDECYEEVMCIGDKYEKYMSELCHCKDHEKLDEDCQECVNNYNDVNNELIFDEMHKLINEIIN